ncbi:hypothetical protein [Methylobacterium crusticola]|uniref:hypothetical protein n=1 Tax=Methylobacterium crusticola TaxID=1697972 RepID=UPI0013968890|nr:hypothetical protein [Methylobacterium crusticola]
MNKIFRSDRISSAALAICRAFMPRGQTHIRDEPIDVHLGARDVKKLSHGAGSEPAYADYYAREARLKFYQVVREREEPCCSRLAISGARPMQRLER